MNIKDVGDGFCEILDTCDKMMMRIDELEYLKEKIDDFIVSLDTEELE